MDALVLDVTENPNCSASEELPPQLIISVKPGYDIFHATE
jgi:hypothetical protein